MTGTSRPLRFGLIGLDSPHAPTFTRLLNGDDTRRPVVPGGQVTAAWPGPPSEDFALSRDRLAGFTQTVQDLGVPLSSSLEDVAADCDALLVLAVDARRHREYFDRCAVFGKPVYIDTRFAVSLPEAQAMLATARTYGALPLTGSPKRFSHEFQAVLDDNCANGIDVSGPLPMRPPLPGLFWYGIHLVDLVVGALGAGCVEVEAIGKGVDEIFVLTWEDGRIATMRGRSESSVRTRGVVHRGQKSSEFLIEVNDLLCAGLLTSIVAACRSGQPMVPLEEIEQVVAVTEAANRSRAENRAVRLHGA